MRHQRSVTARRLFVPPRLRPLYQPAQRLTHGRPGCVMPTKSLPQAKAGVGIHDFRRPTRPSRGWRAFARHDDRVRPVSRPSCRLVSYTDSTVAGRVADAPRSPAQSPDWSTVPQEAYRPLREHRALRTSSVLKIYETLTHRHGMCGLGNAPCRRRPQYGSLGVVQPTEFAMKAISIRVVITGLGRAPWPVQAAAAHQRRPG